MRLTFKPKAVQQLEKLPSDVRRRILRKIAFYIDQEDPLAFATPLSGYDVYRFRIGSYRALFDYDDDTLSILLVVKREGAYRNL